MKNTKLIIILSLLLTILIITSCSENKAKEETANAGAGKKASVTNLSKILPKSKPIIPKQVSPDALEADMKTVEKLLNEWSSGYDSDNKQYSENTYCMLTLARSLLSNTYMLPEHKIRIIDKYNKTQLSLDSLPINIRTNEQYITRLIRDILYWPYPTYGALFLVLKNIVNDNNADEYTKSQAYTRLAQINHNFYRNSEEAQYYLKALDFFQNEKKEDRVLITLNEIADAQKNIWNEHERINILKQTINVMDDAYDKSKFRITLCEAYIRCGKYDYAQEVFDEIRRNSSVNNNNQLNKLEKCILNKKSIYREKETSRFAGNSINEIPNIRIDWRAFGGRDIDSFKQYFGTLLDGLINAEQNK